MNICMLTFRPERRSVERRLTPPNHVSRSQMVVRPLSVLNASSALVTHCAIELTPPDTLLIVGPLLDLVEVVGAERVVGRFVGQICHRAPYLRRSLYSSGRAPDRCRDRGDAIMF
jgi:hypothetical protein